MVRKNHDYDSSWAVLTGGSMSGKTSIANTFATGGYSIAPEIAENYVDHATSHGIDKKQAQQYGGRTGQIALGDMATEGSFPEDKDLVLDRSTGDALFFMKKFQDKGQGDSILMDTMYDYARNQYDTVFHVSQIEDQIGFEDDGTRTKNRELAREIHHELGEFYSEELDYDVIEVPPAPIDERTQIIAESSGLEKPETVSRFF
ncbi:ATP-binding protein [Candidatus Nanohalococcus occultus]|uniref:ATP/GTP-binding protein n=1 Tax=Candidatus Nanohalococcus occultus TaxID=2978047 RepID=UPI0039E0AE85